MFLNLAHYASYKFRPVDPVDREAVEAFTKKFVEAHTSEDAKVLGEMHPHENDPLYWQEQLADRDMGAHAVLVRQGTRVCGFQWWQKLDDNGHLSAAWIEARDRGKASGNPYGTGTALKLYALAEMEAAGCTTATGIVYRHNKPQIHLMGELLGFKANKRTSTDTFIVFERAIDAPTPVLQRLEGKARGRGRHHGQLELAF